jgi:hypothetical protein
VIAVNDVGQSLPSLSTPLVIATVPGAPGSPTKIDSTQTSIKIQWVAPTIDGGSPVTDYEVKVDFGDGAGLIATGKTSSPSIMTWT